MIAGVIQRFNFKVKSLCIFGLETELHVLYIHEIIKHNSALLNIGMHNCA